MVTTIEHGRAMGDFWTNSKAGLENMDFIFNEWKANFLNGIFRMPVNW